ncbi:MAG: type IV secretory system conjugative DNA transfer family protein, partial [Opitutae bacterium]
GYLELLRLKPFLNDPAYTTSYILQHLDWLLLISSFLAILVGLAGIFLLSPIYARLRSKRQNRHLHGSARWMKISEARKYLSNGSLIVGECPRSVLQLGAKDPDLLRFDGSGHLLTVAGSGSGKSISVAIPNALSWTGSLVAHDPKGELARLCSRQRRNMGRNVAVIDPADPTSDTINLLETLDPTDSNLLEDAETIVSWLRTDGGSNNKEDNYFADEGAKLVRTLLWATICAPREHEPAPTLREVRRVITSGDITSVLFKLSKTGKEFAFGAVGQYARELMDIADNSDRQWAGIVGHASQMTYWLSTPNLARIVCGDEVLGPSVSLRDFSEGNLDIFICIPIMTLDATPEPARLLIGSLLREKYRNKAGAQAEKTLFLLDEMPRLKRMSVLETARDFGRSSGVVLWSIIQDLGQLELYYDKFGRQSWFENAQIKTFFGIGDFENEELLSNMLDKETRTFSSVSNSSQERGNRAQTDASQTTGRRLMTPNEIMTMRLDENGIPDEQLMFIRGRPPLKCGMAKYFRRTDLNGLVNDEH